MLNTIDSSLNDLDVHSRSQGHRKVGTCSHSVVKLHEATHMFMMVASVREMTLKKSCNYGEYGSFLHFLLLLQYVNAQASTIVYGSVFRQFCFYLL